MPHKPMHEGNEPSHPFAATPVVPVPSPAPIVKWAGGKRQLLPVLTSFFPPRITSYCEPFLGGGAVLFHLRPPAAIVNDANPELMNMYRVVRDDVEALLADLRTHHNSREYFDAVRQWDRQPELWAGLGPVRRASRLLFLNRTCYNGLYRVNRAGRFNAPFGRYRNPDIVNEAGLRAVSAYFNRAKITFRCMDFAEVLAEVPPGAFVYLDPPYDARSATADFTAYTPGGFGPAEQDRLRDCCDELNRRGVFFLLSNADTRDIRKRYRQYHIATVPARRSINCRATGRGPVAEVVIRNYA